MKTLALAIAALSASGAAAAQSADLSVIGKIVPGACSVTLSGGGVVDLGTHAAASLNETAPTYLPASASQSLTVACENNAAVSLAVVDNRVASINDTLTLPAGPYLTGGGDRYGLGLAGTTKIGTYGIATSGVTVDGDPKNLMIRTTTKPGYTQRGNKNYLTRRDGYGYMWSWGVGTAPQAGKVHTLNFNIIPVISPSNELDLKNEIEMDGSATFNVSYL